MIDGNTHWEGCYWEHHPKHHECTLEKLLELIEERDILLEERDILLAESADYKQAAIDAESRLIDLTEELLRQGKDKGAIAWPQIRRLVESATASTRQFSDPCLCSFAQKMVGDGCHLCNPQSEEDASD